MQWEQADQAITRIMLNEKRFEREAYFFIKEALDYTTELLAKNTGGKSKHVTAAQLLYGFRDHALEEFGPMAATLFQEWGIRSCTDVGDIVFHLINETVFGKQDNDRREDFSEIFDFESTFVLPFLPKNDLKNNNS